MKNTQTKLVTLIAVVTLVAFAIASYSTRILQNDPETYKQIETALSMAYPLRKFHITSNSITTDSNRQVPVSKTDDVWRFPPNTKLINIKVVEARVRFLVGEENEIVIKAKGEVSPGQKSRLAKVDFSADELELKQIDDEDIRNLRIDIYLPPSYKNNISVKSVSGETDIKLASVNEIDVKTVSGETNIEAQNANRIDVKGVSGLVNIKLASAKNEHKINLKTLSGNIKNSYSNQADSNKEISVKTVSGAIDLE